jgi:hypothetical protein
VPEKKKRKELPDNIKGFLLDCLKNCETEDEYIRNLQVKTWKKLEEYWHGIQFLFWSEIAQDWSTPENGVQVGIAGEETRDSVGPFYDYVINMYKAHGESIISALSQSIPVREYSPEDADNTDDLTAAMAKNHLAIIYQKNIKAKLMFIDALFKLYNQGLVAAYRYREGDKVYGIHKVPKYKKDNIETSKFTCPECSQEIPSTESPTDIPTCPTCNMQGQEEKSTVEQIVQDGYDEIPKEREKLDINGPLNVKVPYYARNQKECGYLIWYLEEHYAKGRSDYPEWSEEINPDAGESRERSARTPSSYSTAWRGGCEDSNLTSFKRVWLRPWMYYSSAIDKKFPDEEIKSYLDKNFPDGVHFVVNGKNIVDFYSDDVDKCWTLGKSGPSTFIHSDPIGGGIAPLQEMTNQIANLTIQTIEYGIPALFADSRILNKDVWGKQQCTPGTITTVRKPPEFNSIGDGFYEQKIATPSQELEVFRSRLDQDAEFVVGDQPTISGKSFESGTRTLGEYNSSYQKSLMRLRLIYDYVTDWWTSIVDKGVDAMESDIKKFGDAENTVVKNQGQFENIKVEKKDLTGKASIMSEISENFPLSSDQKMGLLLQLIQLQNPMVESVIGHPENSHIITEALGYPELYIPGEAQRFKALVAIKKLLKVDETNQPHEVVDPKTGQPTIEPTLKPDPIIDEEEVQIAVFKYFLSSEKGMQVFDTNPMGYVNCKGYLDLLQKSFESKQQSKLAVQMEHIQTGKEIRSLMNQKNVKTPG